SIRAFVDYVSGVPVAGGPAGTFEPVNGAVHAHDVTITAADTSRITAAAAGASLAGSFGDEGALSIAIGVSLAHNDVRNQVEAFVLNADKDSAVATNYGITFDGNFTVKAIEDSTIVATAAAASLAAGFSKGPGVALAGAGAEATNVILSNAN